MSSLKPNYFFDLSDFAHRALFDGCAFVWEALPKISTYLRSTSLGKIEVEIPQGVYLQNIEEISIGKGTILEPGAFIRGPCIIGAKCTVRHGAYIRGDFIAGNDCVIGHDTEIKNAVMLNGSHAAHFAYLGDSILGARVNLGAGTKCANLKLRSSPIIIHHEGSRYPTNLRKFGAIIGDGSQIGCNSVTNPGTLLGKNVDCYPCINCGGFIASGSVVKNNVQLVIKSKE